MPRRQNTKTTHSARFNTLLSLFLLSRMYTFTFTTAVLIHYSASCIAAKNADFDASADLIITEIDKRSFREAHTYRHYGTRFLSSEFAVNIYVLQMQ